MAIPPPGTANAAIGALQPLEDALTASDTTLVRVVVLVGVFGAVYLAGRYVVEPLLAYSLDAAGVEVTLRRTVEQTAHVAVLLYGLYVALTISRFVEYINVTAPIVAAVTLAIGFAARDIVSNLVSGVFIVADPTFKIGDWIEWDDQSGVIADITFRVTRVRTFDNEIVSVPNSQLATSAVTNSVEEDRLRISTEFWIDYEDDVDAATTILVDEAASAEEVLDRPEPTARVVDVNDSRVKLQSRIWIAHPSRRDFVDVRSEYLRRVRERFRDEGIRMPPAW